jgi:hypothetical protein
MQAAETIEGDKGEGRYLSKTYSNTVGQYQADANEGRQKLLNDLFTANVKFEVVKEDTSTPDSMIEQIAGQVTDQLMTVRCWVTKGGKQAVKVVKYEPNVSTPTQEGWTE